MTPTPPPMTPPRPASRAPIAEPEEVTDVSVQDSYVTLAEESPPRTTNGAAGLDEPDHHVQLAPDRLLQQVRDALLRIYSSVPLSDWGNNVRQLLHNENGPQRSGGGGLERRHHHPAQQQVGPGRAASNESRGRSRDASGCGEAARKLWHRLCPPFRVEEGGAVVGQESECCWTARRRHFNVPLILSATFDYNF